MCRNNPLDCSDCLHELIAGDSDNGGESVCLRIGAYRLGVASPLLKTRLEDLRRCGVRLLELIVPGCCLGPYTESGTMEISVSPQEASLLTAFRKLAPEAAGELTRLIERLSSVAPERRIDWSDSWSDEDLREYRAASLQRLEANEAEEVG